MKKSAVKFKPELVEADQVDNELKQQLRLLLLELRTISPFFGVLASEMWLAGPSKNISTIAVSERGVVSYNEAFMKSLPPGERIGALVHEALHVALDYWNRFRPFNNWALANKAHDFANNDIIISSMSQLEVVREGGKVRFNLGVKLPQGSLWDPKYKNMSAEEIFNALLEEISERSKQIKAQMDSILNDPAAKAEHDRLKAINQELRKSLIEAAKRIGEKEKEAISRTASAQGEIERSNKELEQMLIGADSISMVDTRAQHDQEPSPPETTSPEADSSQPSGQPSNGKNEESNSPSAPGNQDSSVDPYEQAKDELQESMRNAMHDFLDKESERIGNEYDGKPDGSSREEHLDELDEKLDKIADDYVDKVTQARENGVEEKSNDKPEASGDQQPGAEEKGAENKGGEKGGDQPGSEQGKDNPQPGEGQDAGAGQPSQGEDQPGGGQPSGDGQPGQGGQPSSESPSTSSQSGAGGTPGQGGSQQGGAPGNAGQQPVSEKQARDDVKQSISQMMDEISNSLTGSGQGMPGVDKNMASGQDVAENDAYTQAMKEMMDKLGSNMDGDVDMDCSDIPGNPYKHETDQDLENRRKEMLQRAVVEDMQSGGKGMGTLPGWLKSEIDGILHPPMSFHKEIQKFMGPYAGTTRRSYSARNKRNTFQPNTTFKPGMRKNSAVVYILKDTSGSMMNGEDADNLRFAMGLVEQLAQGLQMEVRVIQADTGITRILTTQEALAEINNNKFEIHGQGGSDFTSAFDYIWREIATTNGNRGNPILVFTDGSIVVPDEPAPGVRQQTIWITSPGQRPPTTKWGDHIVMKDL